MFYEGEKEVEDDSMALSMDPVGKNFARKEMGLDLVSLEVRKSVEEQLALQAKR